MNKLRELAALHQLREANKLRELADLHQAISERSEWINVDIVAGCNSISVTSPTLKVPYCNHNNEPWALQGKTIPLMNQHNDLKYYTFKAIERLINSKDLKTLILKEIKEDLRKEYNSTKDLENYVLSIINS